MLPPPWGPRPPPWGSGPPAEGPWVTVRDTSAAVGPGAARQVALGARAVRATAAAAVGTGERGWDKMLSMMN